MIKICVPNFFFSSFFSSFKNAVLKKKNKFLVHASKLNILLCEYFYKNNYFSEVYFLYSSRMNFLYILVFLQFFENDFLFCNLKSWYQKSKPIYINVKQLKRVVRKEKRMYILSTSEGILNCIEALHLNVGGLILFEYY
jgi:ribosomal protein S8